MKKATYLMTLFCLTVFAFGAKLEYSKKLLNGNVRLTKNNEIYQLEYVDSKGKGNKLETYKIVSNNDSIKFIDIINSEPENADQRIFVLSNVYGDVSITDFSFDKRKREYVKSPINKSKIASLPKRLYERGESLYSEGSIELINDNAYFYVSISDENEIFLDGLYKYNPKDQASPISMILFTDDYRTYKVVSPIDSAKEWYAKEKPKFEEYRSNDGYDTKQSKDFASELKRFELLEKFSEKPYDFLEVRPNDYGILNLEKDLWFAGVMPYSLLETMDLKKNKDTEIKSYVNDVLTINFNKKPENLKILGMLDSENTRWELEGRREGRIYFFYETSQTKTPQILIYDNYENEWILPDYREIKLES